MVDFQVADGELSSNVVKSGYADMAKLKLDTIRLLGAGTVTSVQVNGQAHSSFEKLPSGEVVIKDLGLNPTQAFTVSWS